MSTILNTDTAGNAAPDNTASATAAQSNQGQQAALPANQGQQASASAVQDPFWKDWLSTDGKLNKQAYSRLPEDLKALQPTLDKYEDLPTLLRSFHHAQTLVGKKGLMPLEENAPEAVRKEFDSRLREVLKVPKDVEGYGFKKPDDFDEKLWDNDYASQVAGILHKHAVSPAAAKELLEHNLKYMSEKAGQIGQQAEAQQQEWLQSQHKLLQESFGAKMPEAIVAAQKGARALGLDPADPDIGNNAKFIQALVRVSDIIGEDKLAFANNQAAGGKTAKEEMAEFQRGNLWAALQDPMSAEHPRAQREFSRIAAAIAKEKSS